MSFHFQELNTASYANLRSMVLYNSLFLPTLKFAIEITWKFDEKISEYLEDIIAKILEDPSEKK